MYKARHRVTGELVAVKEMKQDQNEEVQSELGMSRDIVHLRGIKNGIGTTCRMHPWITPLTLCLILYDNCKGIQSSALREISLLFELDHPNIIKC